MPGKPAGSLYQARRRFSKGPRRVYSIIAMHFEGEREDNKRMFRESVTDNNTRRQCQTLYSKTAVYAAHHTQHMASPSNLTVFPMGEEDADHLTQKTRIQPTTDQKPKTDQNLEKRGHLGLISTRSFWAAKGVVWGNYLICKSFQVSIHYSESLQQSVSCSCRTFHTRAL